MLKRLGLGLMVLLLAAACGNANSPVTPTDTIISEAAGTMTNDANANATLVSTSNPGVDSDADATINVTGASETSVEATGTYLCTEAGTGLPGTITIALTGEDLTSVAFMLPGDAVVGTYDVLKLETAPEDTQATVSVTLQGTQVYTGKSGTVTVDSMATGPDQDIKGSFDFTAESISDTTKTVNVTGTFAYLSPNATDDNADIAQIYCEIRSF